MRGNLYPLNGEVVCAERIGRWRPLLTWVLVIPLFLWLLLLRAGAAVVRFLGWFAILLRGQLPKRFGEYLVAVLRYEWRLNVYLYGLADVFPGWRVTAGYIDPGDYPAAVYCARPAVRREGTVFFRSFLIIPQLLVLMVVTLAAVPVLIVAWFAVLTTGRWPKRLQSFTIGWLLWRIRVEGYSFLLVDEYPPFGYQSHLPRTPIESAPSSVSKPGGQRPPHPDAAEPDRRPSPVVPWLEPISPVPSAQRTLVEHAEPVEPLGARPRFRPKHQGSGHAEQTGPSPVAADARYTPPRLLRWPIAVGTMLLTFVLTGTVLRAINGPPMPTYRPPYTFTANDAHFTATFPGKPRRSERTAGTRSVVVYHSDLANYGVAVSYLALPSGATFDLQAGVAGAADGMHGSLLSHTSVIYHDETAEDGVISLSHAVAQVRAVIFGASAYLLEAVGSSRSSFTEDYQRLLDSFTSTLQPPPLATKVVAPPDGFATSKDPQAHTGKVTAAEFDNTWGKGTAASLHEITGYQAYYDSTQGDDGVAVYLYRFASATNAISFKDAVTQADIDAKFRVANYTPISGAEIDESVVDSSGTHEHDIIATKGDTAMIVSYLNYGPTRPPLLDRLARQQYARL